VDVSLGWEGECALIQISVLMAPNMIQGQLWMKPKILADGLDDVPHRPEGVVWKFWARPGNDAMDRLDHPQGYHTKYQWAGADD
jgi:hypothetical protein